jgi:hypothetical protein
VDGLSAQAQAQPAAPETRSGGTIARGGGTPGVIRCQPAGRRIPRPFGVRSSGRTGPVPAPAPHPRRRRAGASALAESGGNVRPVRLSLDQGLRRLAL